MAERRQEASMQLTSRWRNDRNGPGSELERAEHLVGSLDDDGTACCVINSRGTVVAANGALEAFLGAPGGGVVGRSLGVLLEGLQVPFRDSIVRPLFSGERDRLEVKARSVRGDTGESVWGRWDFSLVRAGRAKPHLAVAVVADLTSIVSADRHVRILQYLIGAAGQAQSAQDLLAAAVQIICHFTGCGLGQVWLPVDGALACSDIFSSNGPGTDRLRRVSQEFRYRSGEGLPGAAWERREVVVVTALEDDATDFDRADEALRGGVQAAMAVPISIGGMPTAVLELFVTADRGATDRATLIGTVAAQLGELLERRRLNDALRLSEERFRSVADSAVDAIISADGTGTILTWNRGAEAMFGWRAEEVVGRSLTVIVPHRFQDAHRHGLGRVAATGHSKLAGSVVELAAVRRDGSELPIEVSIGMWESGDGRGFSGVIRDITDRKAAEEAARLSEERFRSVADSAVDAIVSADSWGNILTWNRGAEAMFGWRAEEVVGRSLTVIVPERFQDAHRRGLGRVVATGHSKLAGSVVELAAVRRDGSELPI
jgi:PAS domain S-box-containing protein